MTYIYSQPCLPYSCLYQFFSFLFPKLPIKLILKSIEIYLKLSIPNANLFQWIRQVKYFNNRVIYLFTHLSVKIPKGVIISKQCRPRSDIAWHTWNWKGWRWGGGGGEGIYSVKNRFKKTIMWLPPLIYSYACGPFYSYDSTLIFLTLTLYA